MCDDTNLWHTCKVINLHGNLGLLQRMTEMVGLYFHRAAMLGKLYKQ